MAGSSLKSFLDDKKKFSFSTNNPKPGDIAVWEGHVGIVSEVGTNGTFKLIHARGKGKLSGENPTAITPEIYRPGATFYGYYHPIGEENKYSNENNKTFSNENTSSTSNEGTSTSSNEENTTSSDGNSTVSEEENSPTYYGGEIQGVVITAQAPNKIKPKEIKKVKTN
jgi:hypothetical protein